MALALTFVSSDQDSGACNVIAPNKIGPFYHGSGPTQKTYFLIGTQQRSPAAHAVWTDDNGVTWTNSETNTPTAPVTGTNSNLTSGSCSEFNDGIKHYAVMAFGALDSVTLWKYDFTNDTWSLIVEVDSLVTGNDLVPCVYVDPATEDIYCFYALANFPTFSTIYYFQYNGGFIVSPTALLDSGSADAALSVQQVFKQGADVCFCVGNWTSIFLGTQLSTFTLYRLPATSVATFSLPQPQYSIGAPSPYNLPFQAFSLPVAFGGSTYFTTLSATLTVLVHKYTAGVLTSVDTGQLGAVSRSPGGSPLTYGANHQMFVSGGALRLAWRGYFLSTGTLPQQRPNWFHAPYNSGTLGAITTIELDPTNHWSITNGAFVQLFPVTFNDGAITVAGYTLIPAVSGDFAVAIVTGVEPPPPPPPPEPVSINIIFCGFARYLVKDTAAKFTGLFAKLISQELGYLIENKDTIFLYLTPRFRHFGARLTLAKLLTCAKLEHKLQPGRRKAYTQTFWNAPADPTKDQNPAQLISRFSFYPSDSKQPPIAKIRYQKSVLQTPLKGAPAHA